MDLTLGIGGKYKNRQATPEELERIRAAVIPAIEQALGMTPTASPTPKGRVAPAAPMFVGTPAPLPSHEEVSATDPTKGLDPDRLNAITTIAAGMITDDPECTALTEAGRLHEAVQLASRKASEKFDRFAREVDEHARRALAMEQAVVLPPAEPEDVRIAKRAQELLDTDAVIQRLVADRGRSAGHREAIVQAAREIRGAGSPGYLASA